MWSVNLWSVLANIFKIFTICKERKLQRILQLIVSFLLKHDRFYMLVFIFSEHSRGRKHNIKKSKITDR